MASFIIAVTFLALATGLLQTQYAAAQDISDEPFTLNLKNVDVHSLIEIVSVHTGRNFIVDPRVKATVNVVSSKPVNADKLYELFLSVLQLHGYAAVEAGPITKIIPASVGVQSAVPLRSVNSDAADELVSEVVRLESAPALQVIEALGPLLPESASLSAESTNNTIVITDRADNIEKIIELITLMDGQ